MKQRFEGTIENVDYDLEIGYIKTTGGEEVIFNPSRTPVRFKDGDLVSFEIDRNNGELIARGVKRAS